MSHFQNQTPLFITIKLENSMTFSWAPPQYVTYSVHLSVRLFVAHHISGTVHHLILIFGTQCKMIISQGFFFISLKF